MLRQVADLPSNKRTWQWKILPFQLGNTASNGGFYVAMLDSWNIALAIWFDKAELREMLDMTKATRDSEWQLGSNETYGIYGCLFYFVVVRISTYCNLWVYVYIHLFVKRYYFIWFDVCLCVYLRVFAWFCTGLCDGVTYTSEFLDTLRYEDNNMSHMSVSCPWVRCCHVTVRFQRLFPNFMASVGNELKWWHQYEHFHFRTVAPCCTLLFPKQVS